jgi:hypothetical protein
MHLKKDMQIDMHIIILLRNYVQNQLFISYKWCNIFILKLHQPYLITYPYQMVS